MKVPVHPPAFEKLFELVKKDTEFFHKMAHIKPCDAKGRYLHWDKLRHLTPPFGLDVETYWLMTRFARKQISKELPFLDKKRNHFSYAIPDRVMKDLLWISENATGAIEADKQIITDKTKQTYVIKSLIEEAINSSQLEGASTTRKVAKEMLRTGRAPKDHSEKMIVNNHRAMQFMREYKDENLTPSMVFELHRILTEGTLAPEDIHKAGAFRDSSDDICVYSLDDKLLHVPPKVDELNGRLKLVCDFANGDFEDESNFVPPILRAIIVHFMIGYDHPFVDGNGRTARALFYWIMAKEGYWLMEYISISRVLKKAPAKYMTAYLHTETDDNDVTYFIIHQLDVIKEAISDLHHYLSQQSQQLKEAESLLEDSPLQGMLNYRQLDVLKHALKNPGTEYYIKSHQKSHGVTYQTARTDLLKLSDNYQILKKYKKGKADVFVAPPHIQDVIRGFS